MQVSPFPARGGLLVIRPLRAFEISLIQQTSSTEHGRLITIAVVALRLLLVY
jgi:hypothetical protein